MAPCIRRTTVAIGLAAFVAAAVHAAETRPPDVVLIVVDTLRADRLGAYGNRRGLTPFLDAMAQRAHVVERAYAQAPWTNPSVASLFTSRYPSQHGVLGYDSVLAADETTLAEVLSAAGYATGAFSANGLLAESAGFGQGFDAYRAYLLPATDPVGFMVPTKRADEITDEALGWLDAVRVRRGVATPVFLYLHFMEPHTPYAPPPELLARIRGDKPPLDMARVNKDVIGAQLAPPAPEVLDDIRDTYDAEVLAIDAALGRLMTALERGGLGDALVIITADHGEEFQDHGGMGHGRTLYGEVLHVPLLVLTPGQTQGRVIERLVSLIDVAPTVLDVAGVAVPQTFEGVSFARDLDGRGTGSSLRRFLMRLWDDRPPPVVFSEHHHQFISDAATPSHETAVVVGSRKLITWTDGRREFFALDDDPHEQRPEGLDAVNQETLRSALGERRQRVLRDRTPAEKQAIDSRTRGALRALGYTD